MSEIIESITEFDEGYRVKTSEQEIVMQISMSQSCCEQTGYFMSEEDTSGFIGAELLGLSLTDPELRTYTQDELPDTDAGGVMFVTLTTSKGVLQFVAYNAHNGYYGHEAKVTSRQINHEECL